MRGEPSTLAGAGRDQLLGAERAAGSSPIVGDRTAHCVAFRRRRFGPVVGVHDVSDGDVLIRLPPFGLRTIERHIGTRQERVDVAQRIGRATAAQRHHQFRVLDA